MFKKTVGDIAKFINGEAVGDASVVITGACGIKEAKEGDITFIANSRYSPLISRTQASCVITSYDVKNAPKTIIKTENPSVAFTKTITFLYPNPVKHRKGIHESAVISKTASIGKDVAIGPHCVIEDKVSIGEGTVLYTGVYVGANTRIGKDCLIYPNITIREDVTIGSRVIVHPGTVIGSDGFGYETINGVHHKIPQIGAVVIEDDVEIGANVTIDRARFGKTLIGKGTKIDNLVQIAHNVSIGANSIIVAQVGISGSTNIGKGVTVAGQAGIAGHITIGDNAVIAGQSGVTKSVLPNTCVSGYPAKPHAHTKRINAIVQRLPLIVKRIEKLEKEINRLSRKSF